MMNQTDQELDQFMAILESHYKKTPSDSILKRIRSEAWDHFLTLGLPTRKSEVFRYLKLRNLYSQTYQVSKSNHSVSSLTIKPYIYPECDQSIIVLVNGCFRPDLSQLNSLDERMVIIPLDEALHSYSSFLNHHWTKTLKDEVDPFVTLNLALLQEGTFIYLPPRTVLSHPLQIFNYVDVPQPSLVNPRVKVFIGAHSEATLHLKSAAANGSEFCLNSVFNITIEESAHVKITQYTYDMSQSSWHLEAIRANIKKNATLNCVKVTNGSIGSRCDYRMNLCGENCEAILNGIWMLDGKRESHTHVLMDHQAPHCHSMQLFKGVLTGMSRSSFEGKILVRQVAQKTEAYQLNHNLVLSDQAAADTKPNLEIFADDVKASHGATIGQLDEEQLFYLKTRGYSDQEAKSLLIYGFCKEVIDLIGLPSLNNEVTEKVNQYIAK